MVDLSHYLLLFKTDEFRTCQLKIVRDLASQNIAAIDLMKK